MQKAQTKKKAVAKKAVATPKTSIASTKIRPLNARPSDMSPLAPTVIGSSRQQKNKTVMAPSKAARDEMRKPSNQEINKAIGERTMKAMRLNSNVSKRSASRQFGIWVVIAAILGLGYMAFTHKPQIKSLMSHGSVVQPKAEAAAPIKVKTKISKDHRRSSTI